MTNHSTAELVDSVGNGIVLAAKTTSMAPVLETKKRDPDRIQIIHEYDTPEFLAKLMAHCHRAKRAAIRDDARSQV